MEKLVSIIIPIYNSEKYLRECIESIKSQTYRNIEILCVDNGSTDQSLNILKECEKTDNRVKVLKINQKGVSKARNIGITNANGKYIMFVDSDDIIEKNTVEKLMNITISQDSDMVICTNNLINARGKERKLNFSIEYSNKDNLVQKEKEKTFEYMYKKGIGIQIWNRIVKRKILIENNISFNENMTYDEDMFFSWECVINSSVINIINEQLYKYRLTKNSAIMKYHDNLYEKYEEAFTNIRKQLEIKDYNEKYIDEIINKIYDEKVKNLIIMESIYFSL